MHLVIMDYNNLINNNNINYLLPLLNKKKTSFINFKKFTKLWNKSLFEKYKN